MGGGHEGMGKHGLAKKSPRRAACCCVKTENAQHGGQQQSRQSQIVVYHKDDRVRPDKGQQIRDLVLTIFEVSP